MSLVIEYLVSLSSGNLVTWFGTFWALASVAGAYFMVECQKA